jgi:hypothetical protein
VQPDTVEDSERRGSDIGSRYINDPEEGEMISKIRGRISSAHVIALAALFVALGGTAFAAATIGTNDIKNGAVTKKKIHKNAVNGSRVKKNSLSGKDIDEKSLGAVPTAGHALSADTATIAAKASNVMSAVVGKGAEGCTLLRATQPGTSANIATGHPGTPKASGCSVSFPRDVTRCTYVAGIGDPSTGEAPAGFTTTASSVGNPRAVFVRTRNKQGDFDIRPFHLQVVC